MDNSENRTGREENKRIKRKRWKRSERKEKDYHLSIHWFSFSKCIFCAECIGPLAF